MITDETKTGPFVIISTKYDLVNDRHKLQIRSVNNDDINESYTVVGICETEEEMNDRILKLRMK